MVNSPLYNIFENDKLAILKKISARGFKIGLHANIQKTNNDFEIEKNLQMQRQVLELALEKPISLMSFHQPTLIKRDFNLRDESLYNVYQLVKEGVVYHSDSYMTLNLEAIHQSILDGKNMQLLIHPVWWAFRSFINTMLFYDKHV
jgi:glycerophosphoryl diester phosphodiesterase